MRIERVTTPHHLDLPAFLNDDCPGNRVLGMQGYDMGPHQVSA